MRHQRAFDGSIIRQKFAGGNPIRQGLVSNGDGKNSLPFDHQH
jgi:hypothetical protein